MAKFYQTANGDTGLRYGLSLDFPIPAGAQIVEFDEAANPQLLDALTGGVLWQQLAIVNGQIVHNGVPLPVNPTIEQPPSTLDEAISWIAAYRTALQTATTLADLKIEDAKHPPLPTKN